MITENLVARVVDGEITHWPYRLRPDAKKLHPEVSPLPGSWDQVKQAGLMTALNAVEIIQSPKPDEPVGFDVVEAPPITNGPFLVQQWELVSEAPKPPTPTEPINQFTVNTLPPPDKWKHSLVIVVGSVRGKALCWSDGSRWLFTDNVQVL